MTDRIKQAVLTLALATPVALTAMFAGPLTATPAAQGGARMLGPNFPVLLDTSRDGLPNPGTDARTGLQIVSGTDLRVSTPISCDSVTTEDVTFGGMSGGRFTSASRQSAGLTQSLQFVPAGNAFSHLTFTERDATRVRHEARIDFSDLNRDGMADTLTVSGSVNVAIPLVFSPDSSYVSVPASFASTLGIDCASVPQLWIPLADTNGDGRGDRIVPDLDGNGTPDGFLYASPALGSPAVPTMGSMGLLLMTVLLGSTAVWYLGQRRGAGASPA